MPGSGCRSDAENFGTVFGIHLKRDLPRETTIKTTVYAIASITNPRYLCLYYVPYVHIPIHSCARRVIISRPPAKSSSALLQVPTVPRASNINEPFRARCIFRAAE